MHDPVTPIVVQPALIGWEAKQRKVELLIERAFSGDELIRRMKGWITADPAKVIEIVNRFGRLKVLDDKELVIEFEKMENLQNLQKALQNFWKEVEGIVAQKVRAGFFVALSCFLFFRFPQSHSAIERSSLIPIPDGLI
jgi:hypothetical protein